jgi:hypothetical protein
LPETTGCVSSKRIEKTRCGSLFHDFLSLSRVVLDRGNSSRDFWADRGYHDKPRERWLKLNGWRPHIQRKGQAGKSIWERDKARNKRIARPRARVEPIFTSLAQINGKAIRSIGLARAQFGLTIKSAVYNLKRMSICWKWREEDSRPVSSAYISPGAMSVIWHWHIHTPCIQLKNWVFSCAHYRPLEIQFVR